MRPLEKWMAWFAPLGHGRFGLTRRMRGAFSAWHQGLGMTGGRFWIRIRGGHNLYRRSAGDPNAPWQFAGRADGPVATVGTFPWVGHAADTAYLYMITVVGAGGVEDDREAPRTIVSVDSSGEWAATAPNGVTDLTATPRPGGTFELNWRYDETGQSARPDQFAIFSGTGSPAAVNLAAPVATVSYRFRRGRFRWVSNGFSHATIVHWQVRAVSVAGDSGPVSNMATSTAMATAGAMTVTAVPLGAIDL